MTELHATALHDWHVNQGAKMVEFAGYAMPVQYADGIMQEHLWTRTHAGLFDVSHMGQILIQGEQAAARLESLMPMAFIDLAENKQRYGLLTNAAGGIEDDLMATKRHDDFYVVVNAACKMHDFALLSAVFKETEIRWWAERALLALQGPEAVAVLSALNPEVANLHFMQGGAFDLQGVSAWVSRSGYTGEDGFEISLANADAVAFANQLVADKRVKPAGLGARDSLRLEAGLCLYGNDIDTTHTPIEAGLSWALQKVRKPEGERAGGYPGDTIIGQQISEGVVRKRVGFKVLSRVPVRAHTEIFAGDTVIGEVTSGGFAPSLQAPIAMGYVATAYSEKGTRLSVNLRNREIALEVVGLPFVKKDYKA